MSIHDDVQQALKDLQSEAKNLEDVAGHELVRLYDSLRATTQAIRTARRGRDYEEPQIEAGAGAVEDAPHPEAVASEPLPGSADVLEERANKEPDPRVREKVREGARGQRETTKSQNAGK